MIKILIAAPSAVVRAGLESMLRPAANMEVIGSAADWTGPAGDEADVILLDLDRDVEGFPAALQETAHDSALVLLADDPQPSWRVEALRSGLRGLLPRDASLTQIVAAIEAAAAGLIVVHAEDLDSLLLNPRPARISEALSPRETEVLAMMSEGLPNKLIAFRLGISEHTVKFHVTSVMAKLNAGSRTEAVMLGIRQGLVML